MDQKNMLDIDDWTSCPKYNQKAIRGCDTQKLVNNKKKLANCKYSKHVEEKCNPRSTQKEGVVHS